MIKETVKWMVFTAGYVIGTVAGLVGIDLSGK